MKLWHVVHSKPQKEALLCEQLCLRRIETYYPRIRVQPVNPRAHKIKPYFPGYLFISVDLNKEITSGLRWMAGAIDFVSFGNDPATVPDELIHKIKLRVDIINNVSNEGFGGLKPGVPIIIRDGLFDGYEAIIDSRLSGTKRVRVLLEILKGRQFRLELPVTQIEPMKRF